MLLWGVLRLQLIMQPRVLHFIPAFRGPWRVYDLKRKLQDTTTIQLLSPWPFEWERRRGHEVLIDSTRKYAKLTNTLHSRHRSLCRYRGYGGALISARWPFYRQVATLTPFLQLRSQAKPAIGLSLDPPFNPG
jgi:hypothetical protein